MRNTTLSALGWWWVSLLVSGCTGAIIGQDDTASPAVGNAPGTDGSAGSAGGGVAVTATDCKLGAAPSAGLGNWRRLTAEQYRNTIADLLGLSADSSAFLQDSKTGPFDTNAQLPPQSADIDNYQTAAEKVARLALQDLSALLRGCDPATQGEDACAAAFIDDFGARAYRHNLSETQRVGLQQVYLVGKQDGFAKGIELVVEAALQTPEFLYLAEFGTGSGPLRELDSYELSTRLSYLFWNSMPDAELFEKAKSGVLKTNSELAAQAERLMQGDRFLASASSFHNQLFRVERLTLPGVVTKDAKLGHEFSDALKTAMSTELESFVSYVFASGGSSVRSLLTAKVAFPTGPLLPVYGLAAPPAAGQLDVVDGSRSGILTLPGVMTAVPALPTRHQATMRGNMIRQEVLCTVVPPPDVAVNFMLPPNADELSNQELLRVHKDNPSCSGCHELMDPIGFGFERYNGVGQYIAATAAGEPVDATGYVQDLDGARVDFENAVELTERLAASPQVRSCMARQWFRFSMAREPNSGDECSLAAVDKVLAAGDGDVRTALLALVSSDAFRNRKEH